MIGPRVQAVREALATLAAVDPHELPDAVLLDGVEDLFSARNVLDGAIATRLQVIHARALTECATGLKTKGWLVAHQCLSGDEAATFVTVAKALPSRPYVAAALAEGSIGIGHARRIATSTAKVEHLGVAEVFEKELVDAARVVDPVSLGVFARELRGRLGADESVQAAEARRYDDRWVETAATYEGMLSISGMLDPASAAVVTRALGALTRRAGAEDERTMRQRRADALTAICQRALSSGELPDQHGAHPQVVVTLSYADLVAELDGRASALLDVQPVSVATARMLACDAGIIPAVLGSSGEVLNLGRRTPTWSPAQHRALEVESDGSCGWPGCRVPIAYCQIHHIAWWAKHLGPTDLANGIHICGFHHRLIHHEGWRVEKIGPGKLRVWRE